MPTTITIRNVPDDTRDELAARAARSGRSLQEYLRGQLIEMAHRPDLSTVIDRVVARKRATGSTIDAARILSLRETDRR
jgi:plasmid stability protein